MSRAKSYILDPVSLSTCALYGHLVYLIMSDSETMPRLLFLYVYDCSSLPIRDLGNTAPCVNTLFLHLNKNWMNLVPDPRGLALLSGETLQLDIERDEI